MYDPTLNAISREVGRVLKSPLVIPKVFKDETKPFRLVRAVLGHLLAAKQTHDEVLLDVEVRKFLFDLSKPVPRNIHVFYWMHPYGDHLIVRDAGILKTRGNFSSGGVFAHVLKFFPLAYMVANSERYEGLPSLTQFGPIGPYTKIEIPIDVSNWRKPLWPIEPDDDNILMTGPSFESAVHITARW